MAKHRSAIVASLALALPVLAAGCGDDTVGGCDGDATCAAGSGSTSTDDDGGSASATGTSAASHTSTTAPPGTGPDPDGTTGASATASTTAADGDDTGGDETTGAPGNVVYTAFAVVGGLDRIRIFKHDLGDDHCTWIVLVAPELPGAYDVTTPAGWSVESISASDVGMACTSDSPFMFDVESAADATGEVTFRTAGGVYPCELDVDVTVDFIGLLPGLPPQDTLLAQGIPVTGC